MATSKGKILTEQITFDFFDKIKIEKPSKTKKQKVLENKINTNKKPVKVKKIKQKTFRKEKCNVKSNHKKLGRKVRKLPRRI